jgi:hypothetical protein
VVGGRRATIGVGGASPMNWPKNETTRRRLALTALLTIAVLLGARNIHQESAVMLSGDMARYAMNGVFVTDLLADGGVRSYAELTRYAERYFAKYPALSIGHHPPIPYLSTVPFYSVLGVTLLAARLAALTWFVLAVWGMFSVGTRLFNWQVAGWASALFVTNLYVLRSGQYLLSEMPMTALVLWSLNAVLRFCQAHRPIDAVLGAVLIVASLYAKQLAVLMFPVYALVVVMHHGWRRFLSRRALIALGLVLLLIIPVAIMTVRLSPDNWDLVLYNARTFFGSGTREASAFQIVATILHTHLSIPALIMAAAGLAVLSFHRRREALLLLVWIVCAVFGSVVVAGVIDPARYAFVALPAYFFLIAGLSREFRGRPAMAVTAVLLTCTVFWQAWVIRKVRPSGAFGYEQAATSVLARAGEPAILYDSSVDTGYFVFFMRKHDPEGRRVTLRADKFIGWRTETDARDRIDFYAALKQLGVRWIVAEERHRGPAFLREFHEEFRGPNFAERERIPVISTAAPGLMLILYEYLEAQPADLDAEVRIGLPLGQRDYTLRLRDLVRPESR